MGRGIFILGTEPDAARRAGFRRENFQQDRGVPVDHQFRGALRVFGHAGSRGGGGRLEFHGVTERLSRRKSWGKRNAGLRDGSAALLRFSRGFVWHLLLRAGGG